MKKLFILILFFLSSGSFAEEDMNISISIGSQKLSVVETYVGEPVSRGRRLVISTSCLGKQKEIYNDNYCDFKNFKINDSSISFNIKFYNPDTGECTGAKVENVKLDIKKCI